MPSFNLKALTSAVVLAALLPSSLAAPSILHAHAPLSEYDAKIMARIDQHLAEPNLAHRELDHSHHGHKHVHRRKTAEAAQASMSHTSVNAKRGLTAPSIAGTQLLGAGNNSPAEYYFPDQISEALPTLPVVELVGDIVSAVSTNYGSFNGSGNIEITADNVDTLIAIPNTVTISRDTGKGGYLNGSKIFIFSDTESFQGTTESTDGSWVGFVSNTAAVDWGFNAANGQPLTLRDRPGAFANGEGTMRNFVPFTTGETAYNNAMNSLGFRYAIWPSSSLIPLTSTTAAVFAPIVFTNSNNGAFNYAGTTLLSISVPTFSGGRSGPIADRINNLIFPSTSPEFGCVGGIRSWGSQGIGGDDGQVYIMATDTYGMLLARTAAADIADAASYSFYNGLTRSWSSTMPATGTGQTWINGSFSNADVFYSPRHKTFLMVWQDDYIDNKFLWSYLMATEPIVPAYDGTDYVENILNYEWSETQTLFQAPTPAAGYAYSGGVQMGYFEDEDVTNGGAKMLITWTAESGQAAGSMAGGYSLMSAIINWE